MRQALAALAVAALVLGCSHAPANRGTGIRQTFNATVDEARAAALKDFDELGTQYAVEIKPDMARAYMKSAMGMDIQYVFYFTPGSQLGQTDVEMVCRVPLQSPDYCAHWHLNRVEQTLSMIQLRKTALGGAGLAAADRPSASIRSDVDDPGFTRRQTPDDVALIVGVEKYQDLPKADFAERDAASVKEYVKSLGVPEENVVLLTGQRATRTGLAKYVEEWLPRTAKPTSRVYFYYSGHGAPNPEDGASYLVPYDGDPAFLKTSAYPVAKLYESLAAVKAKEVVVVLDACFSGAGGRSVIAKGLRPLVNVKAAEVPRGAPLAVLSASSSEQVTGALADQGHGLFTYYVLKGLQGEASKSGHVDLAGLYDYVKKSVVSGARLQNREQTPQLSAPDPGLRLY